MILPKSRSTEEQSILQLHFSTTLPTFRPLQTRFSLSEEVIFSANQHHSSNASRLWTIKLHNLTAFQWTIWSTHAMVTLSAAWMTSSSLSLALAVRRTTPSRDASSTTSILIFGSRSPTSMWVVTTTHLAPTTRDLSSFSAVSPSLAKSTVTRSKSTILSTDLTPGWSSMFQRLNSLSVKALVSSRSLKMKSSFLGVSQVDSFVIAASTTHRQTPCARLLSSRTWTCLHSRCLQSESVIDQSWRLTGSQRKSLSTLVTAASSLSKISSKHKHSTEQTAWSYVLSAEQKSPIWINPEHLISISYHLNHDSNACAQPNKSHGFCRMHLLYKWHHIYKGIFSTYWRKPLFCRVDKKWSVPHIHARIELDYTQF